MSRLTLVYIILACVLAITGIVLFVVLFARHKKPSHKYKVLPTKKGPRCVPDDVNGTTTNSDCARYSLITSSTGQLQCIPSVSGKYDNATCDGLASTNKTYTCNGFQCVEETTPTSSGYTNDPHCQGSCIENKFIMVDASSARTFASSGQETVSIVQSSDLVSIYVYSTSLASGTTTNYRDRFYFPVSTPSTISQDGVPTSYELSGTNSKSSLFAGNNGDTMISVVNTSTTHSVVVRNYADGVWNAGITISPSGSSVYRTIGVSNSTDAILYQKGQKIEQVSPVAEFSQTVDTSDVITGGQIRVLNSLPTLFSKQGDDFLIQTNAKVSKNPFDHAPPYDAVYQASDLTPDGYHWCMVLDDTIYHYVLPEGSRTIADPLKWEYKNIVTHSAPYTIDTICLSSDGQYMAWVEKGGTVYIAKLSATAPHLSHTASHHIGVDIHSLKLCKNPSVNKMYVLVGLDSAQTIHTVNIQME
jgi:hypothetical protein